MNEHFEPVVRERKMLVHSFDKEDATSLGVAVCIQAVVAPREHGLSRTEGNAWVQLRCSGAGIVVKTNWRGPRVETGVVPRAPDVLRRATSIAPNCPSEAVRTYGERERLGVRWRRTYHDRCRGSGPSAA